MKVKFKKLVPEAKAPYRAHSTDAGFDLYATSRSVDKSGCAVYGTGLAFEIPDGFVGLLFPRSSVAKKDLLLSNCVGVIDSGYRGEVMMKFRTIRDYHKNGHLSNIYELYTVGDRVGQLIVMPIPSVEYVEAKELEESDRGEGGYGSSGR